MSYPVGGKGGKPAKGTDEGIRQVEGNSGQKRKKDYFKEKMVNSIKGWYKEGCKCFHWIKPV